MNKLFLTLAILFGIIFFREAHAKNYGLVIPDNWQNHAEFLNLKTSENLPATFDWREKLGKEPEVLDQGSCGSCWAFSRVMAITWQNLIKGATVTPAPQELVSCDKQFFGCSGGFFSDYEVGGISNEVDFPYKAKNLRCKSGLPRQNKIVKWMFVGEENRPPSDAEVKQTIYQYGPVSATVAVVGRFPSGCGHGGTNHMIVLTGWNKTGWVMQNSWGKSWKEKGYATIQYGCYSIKETAAVPLLK